MRDPARFAEVCAALPDQRFAAYAHACTHTTLSPNVVHGGTKTNVIPDEVVIELDARILPGDEVGSVDELLAEFGTPRGGRRRRADERRKGSESPSRRASWNRCAGWRTSVYPDAALLPPRDVGRDGCGILP